MEIIDFHVRLSPFAGAVDATNTAMARSGIAAAVLTGGGVVDREVLSRQLLTGEYSTASPNNDAVAHAASCNEGKYFACWFGNPHESTDEYRERAHAFVGLELSPAVHGVTFADPRMTKWLEAANEVGHWVYIVAINRLGCDVESLAAVATQYPQLTFVLGHLGYGNIDYHGMSLVSPLENVMVETSGGYSSVLADAVAKLGAERVVFGSEYPLQDPEVELAKVHSLDLDEEQLAMILSRNAARLVGRAA